MANCTSCEFTGLGKNIVEFGNYLLYNKKEKLRQEIEGFEERSIPLKEKYTLQCLDVNRYNIILSGRCFMSYADQVFINMCRDILDNGCSTEGEKVRPKWEDGSYAYTMKKFGVVNRYDLAKEFPALTLRKTAIKSATDEMLWIPGSASPIIFMI